jgi:hypothetical protein
MNTDGPLDVLVSAARRFSRLEEIGRDALTHGITSPLEAARYLRAKLGRSGDPTALAALELLLAGGRGELSRARLEIARQGGSRRGFIGWEVAARRGCEKKKKVRQSAGPPSFYRWEARAGSAAARRYRARWVG